MQFDIIQYAYIVHCTVILSCDDMLELSLKSVQSSVSVCE